MSSSPRVGQAYGSRTSNPPRLHPEKIAELAPLSRCGLPLWIVKSWTRYNLDEVPRENRSARPEAKTNSALASPPSQLFLFLFFSISSIKRRTRSRPSPFGILLWRKFSWRWVGVTAGAQKHPARRHRRLPCHIIRPLRYTRVLWLLDDAVGFSGEKFCSSCVQTHSGLKLEH